MTITGIVVGLVAKLSIQMAICVILVKIGAVLTLFGAMGRALGGRKSYYLSGVDRSPGRPACQ